MVDGAFLLSLAQHPRWLCVVAVNPTAIKQSYRALATAFTPPALLNENVLHFFAPSLPWPPTQRAAGQSFERFLRHAVITTVNT